LTTRDSSPNGKSSSRAYTEKLRAPKFSALVFVALFLDGTFYPLIALPLIYCRAACPDGLKSLGIRRSGVRESAFMGIFAAIVVVAIWLISLRVYGSWPIPKSATILLKDVLWYPVYEEVTYRGFFLSQLGGYFNAPWKANLAQTALFVLVHYHLVYAGMPIRLLPVFALGLTLGYTFLRSRNLVGCILGHSMANGGAALILLAKAG